MLSSEENIVSAQTNSNPFFNPKVHVHMIVSLTLLFTMQAITLGSFFSEKHHRFQLSMSFLLSAVYFIIILLFLPLFATVTERLRVAFPSVHSKIKTKVNMGFAVFMLIILVRYLIYLCLQFRFFTFFQITDLRAYVPFYISELIITLAYICFLTSMYKQEI